MSLYDDFKYKLNPAFFIKSGDTIQLTDSKPVESSSLTVTSPPIGITGAYIDMSTTTDATVYQYADYVSFTDVGYTGPMPQEALQQLDTKPSKPQVGGLNNRLRTLLPDETRLLEEYRRNSKRTEIEYSDDQHWECRREP